MIEKMKYVCVISYESDKRTMLDEIRNLGGMHISEKKPAENKYSERLKTLVSHKIFLNDFVPESVNNSVLSDEEFDNLDMSVSAAIERKNAALSEKFKSLMICEQIKDWGYFNPEDIRKLSENGIKLYFYTISPKNLAVLRKEGKVNFISLGCKNKMQAIAVLNERLDQSANANEFIIPESGLSDLERKISECDSVVEDCNKVFCKAASNLASYNDQILKNENRVEFSSVSETVSNEDGLIWLCGYVPESDLDKFIDTAKIFSWAYMVSDVRDDDENVPTKVRYTKVTRLIEPVFNILGTIPGYHEYDISFWFLMFFGLFFAMIIGDAGYGFIFLALGITLNIKQKKATNLTLLVYVVSATTIVWGAITGTWFGLEGAMKIPLFRKFVIPAIANYPDYFGMTAVGQQNNMMKFCFMIGTAQLTLACVMNIINKVKSKDLSLVADIGWLMSINALYYVVLLLVINAESNLGLCAVVIITGFLLVCFFGGMSPDKTFSQGLKAGLADSFTNFLNTISAFGNIMSYIRLFAVGLASLAIAQSFNDMAAGLSGFMRVFAIVIFVIGHVLNLAMGLLSVIVHGVRLNLLEFSGQLNMEWSGSAYEPFKVRKK